MRALWSRAACKRDQQEQKRVEQIAPDCRAGGDAHDGEEIRRQADPNGAVSTDRPAERAVAREHGEGGYHPEDRERWQ
jgi:hypothetical protein